MESGAQAKQTFAIFWPLQNQSGTRLGGKKKITFGKKGVSRLRVVHNPEIPYDFFDRSTASRGRVREGRKNCDLEKMTVSLESGAQSKQTFAIFWPLPNESGPSLGGKKKIIFESECLA